MEAATSSSRIPIKPLPYVYSYQVKEQQDAKKLCKSRFKLKNLFLNEYTIKRNKWVHRKHPLIIKRSYFSHLKVLSGLHFPLCFAKIPSFNKFSKQACWSLRNLSFNLYYDSAGVKRFEKHLIRMKHLTNFRDLNSDFDQGTKILTEVKGFEHVKSLAMPCHVAPKRLDKLQKMSIDLQKLEKCGRILKLPLSLIELSLIDNNPLDERFHGEVFWMLKDQLNSLKNLRYLNLISPKKSYYLFLDLELKNVKITIQSQVNFSEALLLQMEDYVEKTDSSIKIVPSGFSQPEDYLRLLSFLENRPRIQLERVLFPFNSTGDLQRQLIGYYRKMLKETNRVEFLFEFHSENGWFEMENIKNFKEMMEIVEKEDVHVIYHFLHNQRKELKKVREKEIIQATIDLFKDKFEKEITMKVTGDVFGFEMLKSLIPKLFEESLLKFDKIYWEHSCLYIAGLGDILRDLTHKRAIKSYSLITYQ